MIENLQLVTFPHPILAKECTVILKNFELVNQVILKMQEVMKKYNGIGLAAPQIGLPWRLFITKEQVYINPVIEKKSAELIQSFEGCLSIPNMQARIWRHKSITVKAMDEKGKPFTLDYEDRNSCVIQHEYDHICGITLIDRLKSKVEYDEKLIEEYANLI